MKCSIGRAQLLNMVELCKTASDPKSEHIAAQSVLLSAKDDTLSARSTNFTLTMHTEEQCAVPDSGDVAINVEMLRAAVRSSPEGLITLKGEPSKHAVILTCSGSQRRYTLHGMNPEHFPEAQETPKLTKYTLSEKLIKEVIARVKSSMTLPSTGRMTLSGIMLRFAEKSLTAVATDGRSLSLLEHPDDFPHPDGAMFLSALAIPSVISMAKESVVFSYNFQQGFVRSGNTSLTYQLPEGTFPDWTHVTGSLPTESAFSFDVDALSSAIRGVTAVASGNLKLELKKCQLGLALTSADAQSSDSLPVDSLPERTFSSVVDPNYLLALLDGAGGGIATIRHDGSQYNASIFIVGDDGFLGVLQPQAPE